MYLFLPGGRGIWDFFSALLKRADQKDPTYRPGPTQLITFIKVGKHVQIIYIVEQIFHDEKHEEMYFLSVRI